MRSCINYNTFRKLNVQLTQGEVPKVIGADGGDLGSMGTVQLMLGIGSSKVTQNFIVCRELRRNIILGDDFAKRNCAGIQWTMNRTRVLSLNGIKAVEVEEDELGIPVTASYHVKIPPRHNAVFEVNIHAETEGTQVIKGNKHLLEKHPNMYQHEIAMMSEEKSTRFPLLAITNLDHIKTLHLAKGEVEDPITDKGTQDYNCEYMQVTGFSTLTRSGRGRSSCNVNRDRQLASGNDSDECMPATGGSGKNSGSGRNASKGARQGGRHKKSSVKNSGVPSDR